MTGCGGNKQSFRNPPPDAWYPEQFHDIVLPPFYELVEDHDQLAVLFAGGAIRHFDATLAQVSADRGDSGKKLLSWYHPHLLASGWLAVTDTAFSSNKRHYRKTHTQLGKQKTELLELRTGRAKKRNIIRIRLLR